jgi:hypothetical protein
MAMDGFTHVISRQIIKRAIRCGYHLTTLFGNYPYQNVRVVIGGYNHGMKRDYENKKLHETGIESPRII